MLANRLLACTCLGGAIVMAGPASPQTWQSGGLANTDYNEPSNWDTGTVPNSAGQTATFGPAGSATVIVNSAIAPNGWTFAASSQDYALSGSTVTFGGAGIAMLANRGVTVSNVIAGTGGVTVNNPSGSLTMSGTNTYTGVTTINAGVLSVATIGNGGVAGNLGAATNAAANLVLGGGTLQYTGAGESTNRAFTLTNGTTSTIEVTANQLVINGIAPATTGGLVKTGAGTLLLGNNNLYTGGTTISAGTLKLGNNGSNGSIVGDIINNATLSIKRDGPLTLAGSISGSGILQLESRTNIGTTWVVLTGTNTYTGETIVGQGGGAGNGRLQLSGAGSISNSSRVNIVNANTSNPGSIFDISATIVGATIVSLAGDARATVNLGADKTLTLSNAGDTFAGSISGTGTSGLTLTGGAATLTGANTYTGATTINGGTMHVDGSIAATSLTIVNAGGTLSGIGTVGTTQINSSGTLAPGTVGTPLTVDGTLTFNAGSTYVVTVSSSASTGTTVTGTASLTGGTVQAGNQAGGSLAKQYTILQSGGLGGTQFAGLNSTGLPAGFTPSLSYVGNDVMLNLTAQLSGTSTAGLGTNQRNVATALDNFFNSGGTLSPGFVTVFGLTGSALSNALAQVAGETSANGGTQAGLQLTNSFLSLMLNPFAAGRAGDAGGPAFSFAPARIAPEAASPYAAINRAATINNATPNDRRRTVWGSAYGGQASAQGSVAAGSNDTATRAYGFAVGVDERVSQETNVGFALAGGGTGWGVANGLGSGQSEVFQAGVHGTQQFGASYVSVAAAYAANWMKTSRTVTIAGTDQLAASFTANNIGARIEAGHRLMATQRMSVTPYAALQVQAFILPGYNETATAGSSQFALAYSARTIRSTRSEIGAWFDTDQTFRSHKVNLFSRFAWAHDWRSDPSVIATFQMLPGTSFTVSGASPPNDIALVTAGAELRLTQRMSLAAKFDGEFAHGYRSYAGTGMLRYSW